MTARSRSRSQGVSPDDGDQNELSALHARDLQMEAGKMRKGKNRGRQSKKTDAEDDFEQESGGKKGAMSPASLSANAWLWCPILVIVLIPVSLLCFRVYNIDYIGNGMDLLSTSVKGPAHKSLVPGQGAGMVSPSSSAFLEAASGSGGAPLIGVAGTFHFAETADPNLIAKCKKTPHNDPKHPFEMPAAKKIGLEKKSWNWKKGMWEEQVKPGCFLIDGAKVVVFTAFAPSDTSGKLAIPSSPLFAMHGVMRLASLSETKAYDGLHNTEKQGKTTGGILGRVNPETDMAFLPSITGYGGQETGGYFYNAEGHARVFEILEITPAKPPVVASTYYFRQDKCLEHSTKPNAAGAYEAAGLGTGSMLWRKEGTLEGTDASERNLRARGFFQGHSCYFFTGPLKPEAAAFAAHGLMRQARAEEIGKFVEPNANAGSTTADIMCQYPYTEPEIIWISELCVPAGTPMWFDANLPGFVYRVEETGEPRFVVFEIKAWEVQPAAELTYVKNAREDY